MDADEHLVIILFRGLHLEDGQGGVVGEQGLQGSNIVNWS